MKQKGRDGKGDGEGEIGRVWSLPYFDYICLAQVHGFVDCLRPVGRESKLWGHRFALVWNSRASVECGMYFQHFEHFLPWIYETFGIRPVANWKFDFCCWERVVSPLIKFLCS